jgi:chemotaxis protein methyltransferase CheR
MSAPLRHTLGCAAQQQLLEAIYQTYHYDFRHYAWPSLQRCIARAQAALGSATIDHLMRHVLAEEASFATFLRHMTIHTSDLFRDPGYFLGLRQAVLPHLATYPFIRVWVAGCGTGEEAYSLAILLHEAGLLKRAQIYATDIDPDSLQLARAGMYDGRRLPGFTHNHLAAGGTAPLSEYCSGGSGTIAFAGFLARRIVFSDHSLATDGAFAEVQLISCRNVLIYFGRSLQERAIDLFLQSLCPRGFLGLGSRETLAFSSHAPAFDPFVADQRIYRIKP